MLQQKYLEHMYMLNQTQIHDIRNYKNKNILTGCIQYMQMKNLSHQHHQYDTQYMFESVYRQLLS